MNIPFLDNYVKQKRHGNSWDTLRHAWVVYVLEKLSILEQIRFSVLLKARLTQPSKFIHKMSPVLIIYT